MNKTYYKQSPRINKRVLFRFCGICLCLLGVVVTGYLFFPVISWKLYLEPAFASQQITSPVPQTNLVTASTWQSLLQSNQIGINFNDPKNWFPTASFGSSTKSSVAEYTISIPKINISQASVSTIDVDLDRHLINYQGTATPPNKGNAVIFGHSTLPQLYNPKDYKTIFANAHTLKNGDTITVHLDKIDYTYKIFSITVVSPEDTSALTQNFDDSYLTIITCTPPGTIWKRLIIKSKLEKI